MTFVIPCAAALVGGALIGLLNYHISKGILKKRPEQYALGTVVRQLLNIGWLLACYAVGESTSLSTVALLVGAALGITLPSLYFTPRLLRLNRGDEAEDQTRKDGKTDG